ncbi:MAG: 23S rRNA (adenine(2503)-C(2))-methyltransferase RlmN [Thermodesulfobacteriota bacterium]
MGSSLPDLRNLPRPALEAWAEGQGLPAFRGRQIFAWLYRSGVSSFAEMTDLGRDLRSRLAETALISQLTPACVETSRDGTQKYAFRLADGVAIESVLIPEEGHATLCLSSQAGCAMGCRFCLTGRQGLTRNLTPAEIVGQVLGVRDQLGPAALPITNLVFMGMGEPLANLASLIPALRILTDETGLAFSSRRITVSTCGLPPRMVELGQAITVNLAISLHAPDDATRSRLMPVNDTYPLAQLLAACRAYPLPPRRRITFEYTLIRDLNDHPEQARALARLLRGIRAKINLLVMNEVPDLPFGRPDAETVRRFQEILLAAHYTAPIRESRGADISAACGQLAGPRAD